MAPLSELPLVDLENPLYCPDVSAHQYMSSIRLFQASVADASRFPYFHRMCSALKESNFDDSPESLPLQLLKDQLLFKKSSLLNRSSLAIKKADGQTNLKLTTSAVASHVKRKSDETSSDSFKMLLSGPAKRAKRSSSNVDVSFILSAKAERLRFSAKMAQLPSSDVEAEWHHGNTVSEEVFWPESQPEGLDYDESGYESARKTTEGSPRAITALLYQLDEILPGLRLRCGLGSSISTHQDIIDVLGIKGHINPKTLSLFRHTKIRTLRLTESMTEADGLNLQRCDTLKLLKHSAAFRSLRSIVLSDVPLLDDDLACLNNLDCLESLFLEETQIGDVAVMHLIAHRTSLLHLELSWNDRITDDAIPTLSQLLNLSFVSVRGTSITMDGLRKLGCAAKERDRKIGIIIPSECEDYLSNLHYEYEVNLAPPLIHDPDACDTLSKSALVENLVVHAECNPDITTDGTKEELGRKLEEILERRGKDMIVQGFMLQGFV